MRSLRAGVSTLIALLPLTALAGPETATAQPPAPAAAAAGQRTLWIVQAGSLADARRNVADVGGRLDRELEIINGVSVYLDPWQIERLRARPGLHLYQDREVPNQ